MQQETPEKLVGLQGHDLLPIPLAPIAKSKVDLTVTDINQTVVGDGHTVGVAPQIVNHLTGCEF
jgi:hypothetical protein